MPRSTCFIALVCVLWVGECAIADLIDEHIAREIARSRTPGASVAVVRNGAPTLLKGYGLANVELSAPATIHTVYQLASVTKPFTATAILLLAEEKKLSLDDAIGEHLQDAPDGWKKVTIRQLLNHTSGIKSYTSLPLFPALALRHVTRSEVVRSVSSFPLEFSPGEKFSYSNTGYFLLGLIIEKVSGTTYGDFLGERIFGPLGMTATRLNDFKPIIANRASGYTLDGDQLRNADAWSPTWPYAAGGLISSVVDMARWEKALADGTLLSEESREQMWRRAELSNGRQSDYALGWGIGEFRGRKLIGHSGGIAGFSTDISRFVDDQVTVIVLANSDRANAARLARGIAAFYIPALNDRKVQPLEDKQPEVTAMIRKILEQSVAGAEVDQSLFTDAARKDIFPDRFKQASAHLRALGRLTGFVLIERSEHDGQTTLVYQATFGESDVRCTVVLTMAGKIAGLRLIPE